MVLHNRRQCLFRHVEVGRRRGLEVGPYCNPTVHKAEGDIRYLDFYSRAELLAKEAERRSASDVVADVDYVVKSDAYYQSIGDTFDYVIANHVIEHVDNPVQWVIDLGRLLVDDGVLFLAVPDKKYNFDRFRADTTLSHLVCDYYRGHGEPREHGMDIWIHYDTTYMGVPLDLDDKLNPVRLRAAFDEPPHPGRHNHVFQSETFVPAVLRPLQMIGLWEYTLLEFAGAADNHGEFYVVLRKGRQQVRLRPEELFAPLHAPLRGPLCAPTAPAAGATEVAAQMVSAQVAALRDQVRQQEEEATRLRGELARARAAADALRASLSWRLTQPGRSVASALAALRQRWSKEAAG